MSCWDTEFDSEKVLCYCKKNYRRAMNLFKFGKSTDELFTELKSEKNPADCHAA